MQHKKTKQNKPPPEKLTCGSVEPHDGANIPSQVPAAGGGGEVLLRIQPIRVDHEVAIGQVSVLEMSQCVRMIGNLLNES